MGCDAEKYRDHQVMKIIQFENIFQVFPIGIIPGYVSDGDRANPTTFKGRKQNSTLHQVLVLENI